MNKLGTAFHMNSFNHLLSLISNINGHIDDFNMRSVTPLRVKRMRNIYIDSTINCATVVIADGEYTHTLPIVDLISRLYKLNICATTLEKYQGAVTSIIQLLSRECITGY